MTADHPDDEDSTPRSDSVVSDRSEQRLAQRIDWKSAIAACPGPLYAELDGLGSGAHMTIEGDDVARRIDLIQQIKQQYQLSKVEAEEVVEYAIALDSIGAMLDYQVVFPQEEDKDDG